MFSVNGIYGHIQRNNAKSLGLLAAFVLLFEFMAAVLMTPSHLRQYFALARQEGLEPRTLDFLAWVLPEVSGGYWFAPLTGCLCWLFVAWLFCRPMLARETGARAVTRSEEPRLYNLVETLAIATGLPVPKINVIETPALNAFSSGLTPRSAVIAVTRGLLCELDDNELEAVLAHEFIHIRNRDTRLVAVATLFSAIVFRMAWVVLGHNFKPGPRWIAMIALMPFFLWEGLAIVAWACIAAAAASIVVRLAVSRTREYLADAGAAELTKNPDALIGALRKIRGRESLDGLNPAFHVMLIASDRGGPLSSHPTLEARITALRRALPGMVSDTSAWRPSPAMNVAAAIGPGPVPAVAPHGHPFRARHRSLILSAVAVDRVASRPVPSLASFERLREFVAPFLAHEPPSWVSHPYVLVPAVAMNFAILFGLAAVFDRDGLNAALFGQPGQAGPQDCFALKEDLPYTSGAAPFASPVIDEERFRKGDSIGGSSVPFYVAWRRRTELLSFIERCPTGPCEDKASFGYDFLVRQYMSQRMKLSRKLDRKHGAPGLAFAQTFYDGPADRAIIEDLRRRIDRGEFDVNAKPELAPAFALALNRPADEFNPCRAREPGGRIGEPPTRP